MDKIINPMWILAIVVIIILCTVFLSWLRAMQEERHILRRIAEENLNAGTFEIMHCSACNAQCAWFHIQTTDGKSGMSILCMGCGRINKEAIEKMNASH